MRTSDPPDPSPEAARTDLGGPRNLEGPTFEVILRTASVVGEAYFSTLVAALTDVLECGSAFVLEHQEARDSTLTILAARVDGVVVPPQDLRLAGSAAERLLEGSAALRLSNARAAFPGDPLLALLDGGGYLAIATHASTGVLNGIVGVADSVAFDDTLALEAVLRLTAPRVGAEIERMRAMAALQAQSELLRAFTDRAQDIILRTRQGPSLAIEYVNPAFERLTGYLAEDLYSDPQLLLRIAHPEDREGFAKMLLESDVTQPTSWRWIRRDGTVLWTEGRRTVLYAADGSVDAIESVSRDVTSEREAEARADAAQRRQARILEAVPEAIIRVSHGGRVLEYRPPPGIVAILPAAPAEGDVLWQLLPAGASAEIMRLVAVAFETHTVQTCRFQWEGAETHHAAEARIAALDADEAVILLRDSTAEELLLESAAREEVKHELELKTERRILRRNPYSLTFREFTVLELAARGLTDKQIASELGISLNTVGKHVSNILGKMQVSSRTEASVRAVQEQLLE